MVNTDPVIRRPVDPLFRAPILALVLVALTGCSVAPPGTEVHDPYEATNRATHQFNKDIDTLALRPAGQVAAAVPWELRQPVMNFSANAGLPGNVLNHLLQGDIGGAATNTMRFLVNSTVGVLGLADPATAIGLAEVETDFGATLAVWGVPEGAYVELPFLGPSTERDAVGTLVDFALDPLGRLNHDLYAIEVIDRLNRPAWIADRVITRGAFGGTVDSVLYESADSYAQTRLSYLQNRRYELGAGGTDTYLDPYAGEGAAGTATLYIDPYAE